MPSANDQSTVRALCALPPSMYQIQIMVQMVKSNLQRPLMTLHNLPFKLTVRMSFYGPQGSVLECTKCVRLKVKGEGREI